MFGSSRLKPRLFFIVASLSFRSPWTHYFYKYSGTLFCFREKGKRQYCSHPPLTKRYSYPLRLCGTQYYNHPLLRKRYGSRLFSIFSYIWPSAGSTLSLNSSLSRCFNHSNLGLLVAGFHKIKVDGGTGGQHGSVAAEAGEWHTLTASLLKELE